ncbi:MAG: PfkB family carbohydrate kinase [Treponema sp.]|jgi:bifunctional ADP-heptose synthase (sugar kinase/adenylyltransferase)/phosphoglycolate phosphatase-like HAD superfamily hydrolase|nr:PfkB family carbohydrate kinase [Treponema sp.]
MRYTEQTLAGLGKNVSLGVVGDLCVDAYYFLHGEEGEVSVETGKPARPVKKYYFDLGGAANVALNLKKLGAARVEAFGLIGNDPFGKILEAGFREGAVESRVSVQRENWDTHVYTKIYKNGVEEPRLDIGNFNKIEEASAGTLIAALEKSLPGLKGLIINEQLRGGFHSPLFQKKLQELIDSHQDKLWFCDCRNLNDVYRKTIHKLNDREALELYCSARPGKTRGGKNREELREVIAWLYERWGKTVVVTRGSRGALAFDGKEFCEIPGMHIVNAIDTVGAGDAFLAAFAFAQCSGLSVQESLELGNFAAGVSVQKIYRTGRPEPAEIEALSGSPDYRYNPELAEDPRGAVFLGGTEIEIITNPSGRAVPKAAVFDHDGTISTLRYGWEEIMEETMIRCILGDAYSSVPEKQYRKLREEVQDFISRTTGIQTLIQMAGLERMVRDAGYVPPEKILDPPGYKKIYNERILQKAEGRLRRLKDRRLGPEDFTIKGAVPFLERLRGAGLKLYLASGTDLEDVEREANTLGYGHLFTKIYGSVGDTARDPKRAVLEKIMGELAALPPEERGCVVFGDGPVELREARKSKAVAVGLVSNEEQRFGIDPEKRKRLVLAGADVLIPDYSWADELFGFLGWRI